MDDFSEPSMRTEAPFSLFAFTHISDEVSTMDPSHTYIPDLSE